MLADKLRCIWAVRRAAGTLLPVSWAPANEQASLGLHTAGVAGAHGRWGHTQQRCDLGASGSQWQLPYYCTMPAVHPQPPLNRLPQHGPEPRSKFQVSSAWPLLINQQVLTHESQYLMALTTSIVTFVGWPSLKITSCLQTYIISFVRLKCTDLPPRLLGYSDDSWWAAGALCWVRLVPRLHGTGSCTEHVLKPQLQ